ncbi:MAG: hypothetical protein AB8D78_01605 [Akkermansiaceae bacterium]
MWKADKNRREATHESGTRVVAFSTLDPKGLYVVGDKTLELYVTYDGDGAEVGHQVLSSPPYHWNDGTALDDDEVARFRELYTEGVLFLGLGWINYN